jgi:hypothetical protein
MQTPDAYKEFFEQMVANSAALFGTPLEIKSFYYTDSTVLSESIRSDISYPCLWLEAPDFELRATGDNAQLQTSGTFFILINAEKDERIGDKLQTCFLIVQKAINYLFQNDMIWMGDSVKIDHGQAQMADNCVGYSVSFATKYQEVDFLI